MKHLRKAIFFVFIFSTLAVTIFAFWFLSQHPTKQQIASAFPLNSHKIFSEAEKITVYSLKPFSEKEEVERFQSVHVLGKTEVDIGSFQKLLKHAFLNDMSTTMRGASCFNPRHGLRVSKENQVIDLLICFECGHFVSFYGDEKGKGNLMGTSEVLFNRTLADAGIEIDSSTH